MALQLALAAASAALALDASLSPNMYWSPDAIKFAPSLKIAPEPQTEVQS
ncbi:MAG TPA: hypothetical protein VLG76_04060 [Rhabdochlamydiaceae bacterium]|nr:hypothetical protein [Rhabdochlamydiaceae bacterium]